MVTTFPARKDKVRQASVLVQQQMTHPVIHGKWTCWLKRFWTNTFTSGGSGGLWRITHKSDASRIPYTLHRLSDTNEKQKQLKIQFDFKWTVEINCI